jgi:hypothetical protein
MEKRQPADGRALMVDNPNHSDEDEIGAMLRHVLAEPCADELATQRWNDLAERIVADLEVHLAQANMEVHRAEARRLGLMLRSWSSLTVRLA